VLTYTPSRLSHVCTSAASSKFACQPFLTQSLCLFYTDLHPILAGLCDKPDAILASPILAAILLVFPPPLLCPCSNWSVSSMAKSPPQLSQHRSSATTRIPGLLMWRSRRPITCGQAASLTVSSARSATLPRCGSAPCIMFLVLFFPTLSPTYSPSLLVAPTPPCSGVDVG
jgi:hypothetical protein